MSRNEEAALHTSLVHLGGPFVSSSAKRGGTSVKAKSYTCVGITELCFCRHDIFVHKLVKEVLRYLFTTVVTK